MELADKREAFQDTQMHWPKLVVPI